jgi:hypothetical protein
LPMLEKVRFQDYGSDIDVEAYTDGYAYDEYSCLYLLSVSGHDSNVKAVTSAVVSGRTVQILSKPPIEAWTSYGQKFRILSSRLPDSLLHQVVAEEGFFRSAERAERLLYVDSDKPARLVYEAVRTGYPVPLLPQWSNWLYRKLRKESHARDLRGTVKVLQLSLDEEVLDSLVCDGVRNGEISF